MFLHCIMLGFVLGGDTHKPWKHGHRNIVKGQMILEIQIPIAVYHRTREYHERTFLEVFKDYDLTHMQLLFLHSFFPP